MRFLLTVVLIACLFPLKASAEEPRTVEMKIYQEAGTPPASERVPFVVELVNVSTRTVGVRTSSVEVIYYVGSPPPLPPDNGGDQETYLEILVERPEKVAENKFSLIHVTSMSGGSPEPVTRVSLAPGQHTLSKLFLPSHSVSPGTQVRFTCRLRTKDSVVAESRRIAIQYSEDK